MNKPAPRYRTVRNGYVLGALILFVLTVGTLRAVGVEGWDVTVAGIFVGLFAGGALGALCAMHFDHARRT
jgi:hypothetical protein